MEFRQRGQSPRRGGPASESAAQVEVGSWWQRQLVARVTGPLVLRSSTADESHAARQKG